MEGKVPGHHLDQWCISVFLGLQILINLHVGAILLDIAYVLELTEFTYKN